MVEINKQELEENIILWANEHIGKNFEFREHQFEAIVDICLNIFSNVRLVYN